MYKGDISNDLPKRVIVVADTFLQTNITKKKVLRVFSVPEKDIKINRTMLSYLYVFAQKMGYTMEIVSFTLNDKDLELLVDQLDHMGTNPFRYFTSYSNPDKLIAELPYRPEVVGVLDLPERMLRYGHWGLDFTQL